MNRPNDIWNNKWDGPDKVSKTVLTNRLKCLSKKVFHESFDDFMKQFTLPYECCSAMIVMMVCVCPTEGLTCRCDSRSCNSNPNCNPNTFSRSLTCTCKLDLATLWVHKWVNARWCRFTFFASRYDYLRNANYFTGSSCRKYDGQHCCVTFHKRSINRMV